jgi:probable addiction module antidote protein
MALHTEPFDVANYLTSDEAVSFFLTEVLEDYNPREIAQALGAVARARGGLDQLAKDTGFSVEVLSKALNSAESPELDVLLKVMQALGVKLSASVAA